MISALLSPDDSDWLAFITDRPDATVFHHPAWMQVLAESYHYRPFVAAIRGEDGAIRAGLPLAEVHSRLTGRRWVSLPFSDYCNPLHTDSTALEALTDYLVELAGQRTTPRVELRWRFPDREALHPYSHYVLHILSLSSDVQQIGRQFDSTHRQNVRAARKSGVRVVHGTDPEYLHAFYRLHFETRRRKGVPVQPWGFFQHVQHLLIDSGLGFVLLAYKDRECLAGAVFFHWGQALMCKYSASHADTLELRPNNLIFWDGIQWGCEHGFRTLDFGRTELGNAGLRDFKSHWGAVEEPLFYTVVGAEPPATANGRLMHTLESAIRHMPPWACRLAGEFLYKHVG